MDKDAYIKQLETENAELKKRIEELERLLGMNSKNSSKPPSSDMRGVSAISTKRRHKKRGARKGHQPHLRQLFLQDQVQHFFRPKPKICPCGCRHFEKINEKPLRHQIVDIPPIVPEVTEYCRDIYRCSDRGARYVERILTVCATCQLQGRSVIRYLRDACRCHLNGIPAPSLIRNCTNTTAPRGCFYTEKPHF